MLTGRLRLFVYFSAALTLVGTTAAVNYAQEPAQVVNPLLPGAATSKKPLGITKHSFGDKRMVLGVVRKLMNDNRAKDLQDRRAEAEVFVTQVLHGPSKLRGQKFVTWSGGQINAGANIITGDHYPLLEIGDHVLLTFDDDDPAIDAGYLLARTHHVPVEMDEAVVFAPFGIEDHLRRAIYIEALRKIPDAEFEDTFLQGLRSPEEWVVNFTAEHLIRWERERPNESKAEAAIIARLTPHFKNLTSLGIYTFDKEMVRYFQTWAKNPARLALNERLLETMYEWDVAQLIAIYRNLFSFANDFDAAGFKKARERFQSMLAVQDDDADLRKLAMIEAGCEFITNKNHSNERRTMIVDDLLGVLETSTTPDYFNAILEALSYRYDLPLSAAQINLLRELKIKPEVQANSRMNFSDQIKFLLNQQK